MMQKDFTGGAPSCRNLYLIHYPLVRMRSKGYCNHSGCLLVCVCTSHSSLVSGYISILDSWALKGMGLMSIRMDFREYALSLRKSEGNL